MATAADQGDNVGNASRHQESTDVVMGAPMDGRGLVGPLLTLDEVRQRLAALAAELKRLDHDQTMIARAFHIQVAQTVYDALLEDEVRLSALPTLDVTVGGSPKTTLSSTELDTLPWSATGPRGRFEVLDLGWRGG
jgi:hypothetical protein